MEVYRNGTKYEVVNLPKWVQEYIKDLKRERDLAVRALNEWTDAQTPGPIFVDELVSTGEEQGPSCKRRYIHGRRVSFRWLGVELDVLLRSDSIDLSWMHEGDRSISSAVALVPYAYMQARLVAVQPKQP